MEQDASNSITNHFSSNEGLKNKFHKTHVAHTHPHAQHVFASILSHSLSKRFKSNSRIVFCYLNVCWANTVAVYLFYAERKKNRINTCRAKPEPTARLRIYCNIFIARLDRLYEFTINMTNKI